MNIKSKQRRSEDALAKKGWRYRKFRVHDLDYDRVATYIARLRKQREKTL